MMRAGAFLVAFVSAVAFAGDPGAPPYGKGMSHFSRGEWKAAIKHLVIAALKLRTVKLRASAYKHIGLAQVELGKNSAAEQAFVLALTVDSLIDVDPVSDPPAAVALFRSTREKLEGALSVAANRPLARLFVDGNDRGPTPWSGAIKIGRRQIRVATPDGHYERVMDNVVVGVGKTVVLTLDLEARVGFLAVTGAAGSDVHVDGAPVGRTPLKRVAVAPGKRTVSVSRAGFDSKMSDVEIEAGRETTVDGTLVKSAPAVVATPPAKTEPSTATHTSTSTTTTTSTLTTATTPPLKTNAVFEPSRNTRPWGWVTLGVSTVSLAVGSILYFATSPTMGGSRETVNADVDSANLKIDIGTGLMIGGGIIGGVSLALFLLHKDVPSTRVSFDLTVPTLSGPRMPGFAIAIRR
ncbi:MAG: PEGA domain-containing protein [Deltaproteobacteria bacterium]|nr:PEGA domain-containing protein [Deltaproteobacteria bacterium]